VTIYSETRKLFRSQTVEQKQDSAGFTLTVLNQRLTVLDSMFSTKT